jgi:DNA-binding phage protein
VVALEGSSHWHRQAGLLGSEASQLLLLKDALQSQDVAVIVSAFDLVARVCGLGRLAARASYDRNKLLAALSDEDAPDLAVLAEFVERFAQRVESKRP